jgi:hypothetical protein
MFDDTTASELSRANSMTPSHNSSIGNENRRFKKHLGRNRSSSFKVSIFKIILKALLQLKTNIIGKSTRGN